MKTFLKNRSLIKVSGPDSEVFLQSQFSNDIKSINEKKIQINAYCQHQGKIIALIWVLNDGHNYFLSIPTELKEIVLLKLNMFKLMSNVLFEDVSEVMYQYGLILEGNDMSYQITNNLSLFVSKEPLISDIDNSQWEIACVNDFLPEVYFNLSEKFVPHSLNLDVNEMGVSFTKGCYPGQEVIARMHYLGKPKRRIFRFSSKYETYIGDSLDVNNSKSLKSSGQVIRVAKENNVFFFLGVFEVNHIHDQIFLNNDQNKVVCLTHE